MPKTCGSGNIASWGEMQAELDAAHYKFDREDKKRADQRSQIKGNNPDKYVVLPYASFSRGFGYPIIKKWWRIALPNNGQELLIDFPTEESAKDLCVLLNHGHALRNNLYEDQNQPKQT